MPIATSGNDSLIGTVWADTISGLAGNDTIYGNDGNDEVYGGAGADSLYGGNGNDAVSGGTGNDLVDGGAAVDNLVGGQGADTLYGGTGNDILLGDGQWLSQASYASGILGLSTTLTVTNSADGPIYLEWIDSLGNPHLLATIAAGQTYAFSTLSSNNYILKDEHGYFLEPITGAFNQTVTYGLNLGDVLYGGANDDSMLGQYGDDTLYGDDGNDTVEGGTGNDCLFGGIGNDSLKAETGNDAVYGGAGNDTVSLGDGNDSFGSCGSDESGDDSIDGGLGNDSLIAGAGNDQLYGGNGDDFLSGATGNDTLYGGLGNDAFGITDDHQGDTIYGGENAGDFDQLYFSNYASTLGVSVTLIGTEAGNYSYQSGGASGSFAEIESISTTAHNDTLNGAAAMGDLRLTSGAGDDSITTGSGNDTISYGSGNDTVFGGAGNDVIDDVAGSSQLGNDLIYGGGGNDIIWSGLGNDTLSGDAGDDSLLGEAQDDLLYGGTGNDLLDSGVDNDRLYGGSGADRLDGGSGNDTLSGGADDDTLAGATGNDYFTFDTSGGHDLVSDFDMLLCDGHTADQLDVSDLHNADGSPVRPWDITVSDDGHGQALLNFPGGESVVLGGVSPAQVAQHGTLHSMGVPCFAAGTRIMTPQGEQFVEDISVGDLVTTASGHTLPVLWHGQRRVEDLAARPQNRPIRLAAGGFGNRRDLLLSPQHGVYLPQAAALIRARHLVGISPRARIAKGIQSISYHHLLLPQHSLLLAEGARVESFYPGAMALAALATADRAAVRAAILALCPPEVTNTAFALPAPAQLAGLYGPRCVPLLTRTAAAQCFARPEPAHLHVRPCPQALFGNQLALIASAESAPEPGRPHRLAADPTATWFINCRSKRQTGRKMPD